MSNTPDTIFAKSYGNIVAPLAQQEGSKLRNKVMVKTGVVGEETYMDQMTAFDVKAKGGRLSQTNPEAVDTPRRRIAMEDYYIAKALDKFDNLKTLADPTSAAVQNGIYGMGRKIDKVIYDALRGTAYIGKVGGSTETLSSAEKIAVGGTGLTVDKLLEAKQKLDAAQFPMDRCLVLSSYGEADLINQTEVKSFDYNTQRVMSNGKLDSFLGFEIVRIDDDLFATSGNTEYCLAFSKKAAGLAIGQDIISRITEESTLHFAKQLYFSMSLGASRLEKKGVVEIAIDRTA